MATGRYNCPFACRLSQFECRKPFECERVVFGSHAPKEPLFVRHDQDVCLVEHSGASGGQMKFMRTTIDCRALPHQQIPTLEFVEKGNQARTFDSKRT